MKQVLVSEWASKAAHNLDMTRDTWVSQRATSDFIEPQLKELRIDDRIDHAAVLGGTYDQIQRLYGDAVWDTNALEAFLSKINAEKLIDGLGYPRHVFEAYRSRVVKELAYKKTLCSVAKEAMRLQRIIACDGKNPNLKVIVPEREASDLDLLEHLLEVMRVNMQVVYGDNWVSPLRDEDRDFIDHLKKEIRRRRLTGDSTLQAWQAR